LNDGVQLWENGTVEIFLPTLGIESSPLASLVSRSSFEN
jgi:hypothetical protein